MENAMNSPIGKFLQLKIDEVSANYSKTIHFQQIFNNLINNKYENIGQWRKDVREYFFFCFKLFGPDTEIGLCFKTLLQIIEDELSEAELILPNKKFEDEDIESLRNHFQGATANAPNNRKQLIAGLDVPLPIVRAKMVVNDEIEPYIDPYQIEFIHKSIKKMDEKKSRRFLAILSSFEKCGIENDRTISYDLGLVSSFSLDLLRQVIVSENAREKRQEKTK